MFKSHIEGTSRGTEENESKRALVPPCNNTTLSSTNRFPSRRQACLCAASPPKKIQSLALPSQDRAYPQLFRKRQPLHCPQSNNPLRRQKDFWELPWYVGSMATGLGWSICTDEFLRYGSLSCLKMCISTHVNGVFSLWILILQRIKRSLKKLVHGSGEAQDYS